MNQQIGYDLVAHSALDSMNHFFLNYVFAEDQDAFPQILRGELQNFIMALDATLEEQGMTDIQTREIRDSFTETLIAHHETDELSETELRTRYAQAIENLVCAEAIPNVVHFYVSLEDER